MDDVRAGVDDGDAAVRPSPGAPALRDLRPGDLGWIVHRHGVLYFEEFRWDARFEALVAEILGAFGRSHDATRERGWVAEVDGRFAGCVFLVGGADPEVARLRCLLVEPSARGRGVGSALVGACITFAREAGYRRVTLWTNSVLEDARRLYERAGFRLVSEEPLQAFGHDLVSQTWELEISQRRETSAMGS